MTYVYGARAVVYAPSPTVHEEHHHYYYDRSGYEGSALGSTVPADASVGELLSPDELYELEVEVLRLVNAERRGHGRKPLQPQEHMSMAALHHSAEMYGLEYFSHTSPVKEHESFTDRLRLAGVASFGAAAENIGAVKYSEDVARRLVSLWMESPGHRANILREDFRFTGIGLHGDETELYATQLFATEVKISEED